MICILSLDFKQTYIKDFILKEVIKILKKFLFIGIIPVFLLAGCMPGTTGGTADLFGGAVIETGQSDVAPTGAEYEILFNKEVTNVHNSVVAIMSLNNSGNVNNDVDISQNEMIVCEEALNNFNKTYKTINDTLPAKGWEEKKDDFIKTLKAIIETTQDSIDSKKLNTKTLRSLEISLAALTGTDSGATSLNF